MVSSNIANTQHIVNIAYISKSYQVSDASISRNIAIIGTVLEASFTKISNYTSNEMLRACYLTIIGA